MNDNWYYDGGEVKQYKNGNLHIKFSKTETEYVKEGLGDGKEGLRGCFECLHSELAEVTTITFGEDMCLGNYDMGTKAYNFENGMVYVISWSELKYALANNRTLILKAKEPDGWDYVELYEEEYFNKEDLEEYARVFKMEGENIQAKIIYDELKSA